MKVPRRVLAQVIADQTMEVKDGRQLAKAIAAYLIGERYTGSLQSLLRDVMQIRQEHGIIEATAVSAHELGEAVMRDIFELIKQEYPDAKSVIIDSKIESQVVGGVRIDLPHEQLDMTVKAKLNTLRRLTA